MKPIVLQLTSTDASPHGSDLALSALSQQLSAFTDLQVRPLHETGQRPGGAGALAVSLMSGEGPRALATALAAWSGQHARWRVIVKWEEAQVEVSGATPQPAQQLLQRLLAAAPPPVLVSPVRAALPPEPAPAPGRFSLRRLPDGPETPITGEVTAGRHPDCGLRLPAATTRGGPSRFHAKLTIEHGELWVEDLGSTNGTFLNESRLTRKTRLRDGDRLRFDRIDFEVSAPVEDWEERTMVRTPLAPMAEEPALSIVPPRQEPVAAVPPPAPSKPMEEPLVDLDFPPLYPQPEPVPASVPEPAGPETQSIHVSMEQTDIKGKTVFIPPDQVKEMTALVVDGARPQRPQRRPDTPARRTHVQLLDESQAPVDPSQALRIRQRYILEISVRVWREALKGGRVSPPPGSQAEPAEPEWVWVVLSDETEGDPAVNGRLFELEMRYTAFKLPASGDSEGVASFRFAAKPPADLGPEREGRRIAPRIGVRLYHKLNLIDHAQVELRFAEINGHAGMPGERIPAMRVYPMAGENHTIAALERGSASRALTISISKPEPLSGAYRLAFVAGNRLHPEQPGQFASRQVAQEEMDTFLNDFRDILLAGVLERSLTDPNLAIAEQETLLARLAALGSRMTVSLLEPPKQDDFPALDQLPEGALVQICLGEGAQDLAIPWQILLLEPLAPGATVDPRRFWGYRFCLEVKRCGDGVDHRPIPARQPPTTRVTYARWSFETEANHHARLKQMVAESPFPASLLEPAVEARASFAEALLGGGGELLYVYAHGHAAAPATPKGTRLRTAAEAHLTEIQAKLEGPQGRGRSDVENLRRVLKHYLRGAKSDGGGSALTLNRSELELSYLQGRVNRKHTQLGDAPLVFLNTCESAQIWPALTDSFVSYFLDLGARAVVSAEFTVPLVVADVFGVSVLESLFRGEPLGKAVFTARWKLLNEHRNPLGLCYGLYGAADALLRSGSDQPRPEDLPTPALTFISGPMRGGRFILRVASSRGPSSEWTIGRDAGQDIVLAAEGVSGRHATLVHEKGRWKVIDALSKNGTYVNNRRVAGCTLSSGDELRMGTVTAVFELLDRFGQRWDARGSAKPVKPTTPPIDAVLFLVASIVAASLVFFLWRFLR